MKMKYFMTHAKILRAWFNSPNRVITQLFKVTGKSPYYSTSHNGTFKNTLIVFSNLLREKPLILYYSTVHKENTNSNLN